MMWRQGVSIDVVAAAVKTSQKTVCVCVWVCVGGGTLAVESYKKIISTILSRLKEINLEQ
jgi:hypothetical protein